ncbi:HvfC/BufC N-terminal domain-containing protein [Caulobacter sp. AP07]|uniref:HvfC/BufC N-terminal domain-containing protein n=1 Tax=Caulobacter sp. AP07 TaxID=1144304 RepID=UPI001930C525|nr:putative DNA-binding domain-containing protein [Caulobacter sp. AP07]
MRLAAFAEALLDPTIPPPEGLIGPDGRPSAKRFAVYRNNVVLGLVETLKAAFPVTRRLVGDDFFAGMARVHVARAPPASPVMLDYGAEFADFVGRFEPAATLPYLPDVVRLERAWTEAYHAAEALPLSPGMLTEIPQEDLLRARLLLHPSVRMVRSAFPVVEIWRMHDQVEALRGVDLGRGGEDALIARPKHDVELRSLPPGAADFVEALLARATIGEALARGLSADSRFDPAGGLIGLARANLIVGVGVGVRRDDATTSSEAA